jgi:hypothetical protein
MKSKWFALCLMVALVSTASADGLNRLDRSIRDIVSAEDPLRTASDRGLAVRDGRVQVVAVVAAGQTAAVARWLEDRGGRHVLARRDRVQAFVPPEHLVELLRHPGVLDVERPNYALVPEPGLRAAPRKLTNLAVTSEGVAPTNAPAWHAEGFTGNGVRVGVIDVEFGGWDDLLGVELPPADRTIYRAFGGANVVESQVHGTACAEIVHDLAPDADLLLAHIRTQGDLYASLDWLASESVDVVTMSLGWYGTGPGDGTGRMADELQAFIATTDALFLTSAGNERRSHWQGSTIDADGNGWVDFVPGDDLNSLTFSMTAGDRVSVNIAWNDWASPISDYSLHLFDVDGPAPVEVAVSDRPQNGLAFQTPYETISYTSQDGGIYGVRISRVGVAGTHDLELFSVDSDLEIRVGEGSLTIPGDTDEVIAVAAVNYNAPYLVRNFSSAGPANGPGGSISGGSVKPDLSGFDGVSTVSYGPSGFFGTSAASPHAAGVAAVVRDAEPGMSQADVRSFLEGRAVDLGSAGQDNDYGWGRIFLGQTPGSTCTFVIDPVGTSVPAGGGGGTISVATDDGCPWTTSSLAEWLTVLPPAGIGNGIVGFTAAANSGAPRTGQIVVAGLTFSVTQAGGDCGYTLNPSSQSFPSAGGSGVFFVDAEEGCPWEAVSNAPWIEITGIAGISNVLYSVDAHTGAEQRTGTISVADQDFVVVQDGVDPKLVMVAGIAETEGLAQTRWKSDLAILNPGDETAVVNLAYRHGTAQEVFSLTLAPGEIRELVNVAATAFGAPDTAGAVEIQSEAPLIVTARTYNDTPGGTFGQYLPGVRVADGLPWTGSGVLSQLAANDDVRTNIGFVDLSGSGATARIRLFDGSGAAVGTELGWTVPAGGWSQVNRVFQQAGAGPCTGCYALIDFVSSGGPMWAYASVVDNESGDPTTIPVETLATGKISTDRRYLVAGVAETEGANSTTWKTDLALLNLSGAAVSSELVYRHGDGSAAAPVILGDGELREFANIAADLFGAPGSAGAVDVAADGELVVTARTFNDAPEGTFGQFLPGLETGHAMVPGDDGFLSQLKSTDRFRTNIGFTNYSDQVCTVRVFLHDEDGERTGMLTTTVPAGGWTQVNRVFQTSGVGACPLGYAMVEVLNAGCRVWAYASVVDNDSGDPTTVPVVVE